MSRTDTVRVADVLVPVTALGPGRRVGVWFQGCTLSCSGCMSRQTWDRTGGRDVFVEQITEVWRQALGDGYDGLTVSGGEPLEQPAGLAALLASADAARTEAGRTDADLLVYTGWETYEIAASEEAEAALAHADALVTGRFLVDKPTRLVWRGSANQRIVMRTERGRQRYGPHEDRETDQPDLQVVVTDDSVQVVGVPRRGALTALERALRARGITFEERSWRP